jgi:hypothetical protein
MGGNNPKSKIVAILCPPCHDQIDNGEWGNGVKPLRGRDLFYFAWDLHGNTLIEKEVMPDASSRRDGNIDEREVGRDARPLGDGAEDSAGEYVLTAQAQGNAPGEKRQRDKRGPSSAPSPSAKEESDGTDEGRARNREGGGGEVPEGTGEEAMGVAIVVSSDRHSNARAERHHPPLTHDQRVAIAQEIHDTEWNRQWRAGDTANQWRDELGEEAEQYISDFGYVQESIANIMRVCAAIKPPYRNGNLRYSHHVVIYELPPEDQMLRLTECEAEGWSVAEFRRQVKGTKPKVKRYSLPELDELLKKFVYESDEESVPYPTGPIGDAVIIFFQWLEEQG